MEICGDGNSIIPISIIKGGKVDYVFFYLRIELTLKNNIYKIFIMNLKVKIDNNMFLFLKVHLNGQNRMMLNENEYNQQ
jgi:hypothetical protein